MKKSLTRLTRLGHAQGLVAALLFAVGLALGLTPSRAYAQTPAKRPVRIDPRLREFARGGSLSSPTSLGGAPSIWGATAPSRSAPSDGRVRVLALLGSQAAERSLSVPNRYDTRAVLGYLRRLSERRAQALTESLRQAGVTSSSGDIEIEQVFWLNSSVSARVTPRGLKLLAERLPITKIYDASRTIENEPDPNQDPLLGLPTRTPQLSLFDSADPSNLPADLIQMRLGHVYKAYPGLRGQGSLLGSLDTGADGRHPALAGRIAAFWNGATQAVEPDAVDLDSHGTHTVGTMVGLRGQQGFPMGVAPEARILVAAGLTGTPTTYDAMIKGMQYMLESAAGLPRAVNNSWNSSGAPDQELFYRAIQAWESAGVLPVFSAGNSGPGGGTITKPKEHPLAFAVGALDPRDRIASFSSRGPGNYKGQPTQKPDVAAPGVDVISSLPGGRYGAMSGTSMAAPHVTGLVALLVQANPRLTPPQLRKILIDSAIATAESGQPSTPGQWNRVYGYGRIDALKAVELAQAAGGATPMVPGGVRSGGSQFDSGLWGDLMSTPESMKLAWIRESGSVPLDRIFDVDDDAGSPSVNSGLSGFSDARSLWGDQPQGRAEGWLTPAEIW